MHNEMFKTRWFVLARVPHATVLIYYDRKCMDEDHILGYVDMRRVTAVKEAVRPVVLDSSRSAAGGLFSKLKSMTGSLMGGSAPASSSLRPVIELVTVGRTYVLCPASVDVPPPVNTATASAPSIYGKPLYLFGWAFPVPHLEGAVMSSVDEDGQEDEHALEQSRAESDAAAARLFESDGKQEVRRTPRRRCDTPTSTPNAARSIVPEKKKKKSSRRPHPHPALPVGALKFLEGHLWKRREDREELAQLSGGTAR
jgi:hypothetical protein